MIINSTEEANNYVINKNNKKIIKSENYNYLFNYKNGETLRWGKTIEDNPDFSPFGPEILDIEISEVCSSGCKFCYKSNVSYKGRQMSLDTFKKIFRKLSKTVSQIAFGIGNIDDNKDLFKIFEYCLNNKYNKVIPNITINGKRMIPNYYDLLVKYCGAVSVSHYNNSDCYDTVFNLTNRGLQQVNIHQLVANETYEQCLDLIDDVINDKRLKKLNSIVFLTLKPKGDRNTFHKLTINKYNNIIIKALEKNINFGTDSCGAPSLLYSLKSHKNFNYIKNIVESCESTLTSLYINVVGDVYPCSFTEDEPEYKKINILECDDFIKDIWYNDDIIKFRNYAINQHNDHICGDCRFCPAKFDIYDDKIKI